MATQPNAADTKVALVTGANKGIGREIARGLGRLGYVVLAGARDEARGRTSAAELAAEEADIRYLPLDVTVDETVRAAAKYVEEEFGRLDVLVNNAGISVEGQRPPHEITAEEVRRTMETNVIGVVAVIHAMLPLLRRSAAARVVNLSTGLGSLGLLSDPDAPPMGAQLLGYGSSKAALNAITIMYAKDLADDGIKVNSVSPGYCATDFTGNRGYRTAQQGAAVAVELATVGDEGPTGAFLNDDGPMPW
ncbi:SDR family oxidoreductase [Streptomyces yerevanensis]|uniref:SDR family oxidoreductase n=1 Tax=Streptomyces yerevanensis TaxID=66378 RepID=UPI00052597F8|nr:SDR family oxidoreductase [Streptomyces yerevanensis]